MTRLSSLLTHCTAMLRLDHFFCISSTPEQRAGNLRTDPITKPLRIKTKGETASTCFPFAKAAKKLLLKLKFKLLILTQRTSLML